MPDPRKRENRITIVMLVKLKSADEKAWETAVLMPPSGPQSQRKPP